MEKESDLPPKTPEPTDDQLTITHATWMGFTGIVIWAGFFILAWGLISLVVGLAFAVFQASLSLIGSVIGGTIAYTLFFILVGMFVATIVAAIVISTVCLFNYSMGYVWSAITATSLAGGLTGFLCVSPLLAAAVHGNILFAVVLYLIIGIPAMCCGHFGAVRAAVSEVGRHHRLAQTPFTQIAGGSPRASLRQFEIKQLLAFTAWCGALVSVLGAVFQMDMATGLVLLTYFPVQYVIFVLCQPLTSRYVKKRLDVADFESPSISLPAEKPTDKEALPESGPE